MFYIIIYRGDGMKKSINLKISVLRKKKGITQQELADVLGVSFQTISKWENGVTMPDISILPELVAYFDVTTDELLGLKPLKDEEYLSGKTDTKEFWERKLEYLLRTRKTFWNTDYMKFLIDTVWKVDSAVKILDCGCGYGSLGLIMMPLLPEGSTYTGIDFADELIEQGKKMFLNSGIHGEFIKKDFYEYPVTEKYDIVICQAVLRHLGTSERFISKMLQHGKENALIVCIDTNREIECDGLYVEGMDYMYLCDHTGMEKHWKTELNSEGRDYAAAMRTAYSLKKLGVENIEIRMNDKVSFVHPEIKDYNQTVEDFMEFNDWNYGLDEKQLEKSVQYMMNHGMSRKEADSFLRKSYVIGDYFKENKGHVSYTHFYGKMITFGRKASETGLARL
jgi:2-polyprenyl-3-methyl-5-hydroxy-6-metoxy-1,4-benzoquinol methylase/DNA-binding XRE family transcriptional regulator